MSELTLLLGVLNSIFIAALVWFNLNVQHERWQAEQARWAAIWQTCQSFRIRLEELERLRLNATSDAATLEMRVDRIEEPLL